MSRTDRFGEVNNKFWIVVSEEAGMTNLFPARHEAEGLAVAEGRRLAKQHPGVKFLIFGLSSYVVTDVVTVKTF